ncbi:hypothetical protein Ple7327_4418 [Pleurocapsa sp. PCC 7327]|nr:hypothetical protein Ple7327_4418 [Pleurocapsa sp. PCC 7327]
MLCNNCLRQRSCWVYKLAQADARLLALLKKLKQCEIYQPA